MEDTWYVRYDDSASVGPMTTDQVIRGIQAGEIPATCLVARMDSGPWLSLKNVRDFTTAVQEPPRDRESGDGHASEHVSEHDVEEASTEPPEARANFLSGGLLPPGHAGGARSVSHTCRVRLWACLAVVGVFVTVAGGLVWTWYLARGRNVDEQLVQKLVDDRLVEYGVIPSPSASASSDVGGHSMPADAAAESLAFLARLEEVMQDFRPLLPPVEDKSDMLRCVTAEAVATDPRLLEVTKAAKRQMAAYRKEKAAKEREFRESVLPLAYRIDYDWKTRMGEAVPPVYGCLNVDTGRWTSVNDPDICAYNPYSYAYQFKWKVKVPGRPAEFVYSNGPEPPTEPPELMKRLAVHRIVVPKRFSCRIADILSDSGNSLALCDLDVAAPRIRLTGERRTVNVGDLVSVPLADTRRDPDGVLLRRRVSRSTAAAVAGALAARKESPKSTAGSRDSDQRGHRDEFYWLVDADWSALTIDEAATCPTVDEVVSSMGDGGS